MSKRIYVVTNNSTQDKSLVRAANSTQARNAAAKGTFGVELASQNDLVALVSAGIPVVNAVEDEAEAA